MGPPGGGKRPPNPTYPPPFPLEQQPPQQSVRDNEYIPVVLPNSTIGHPVASENEQRPAQSLFDEVDGRRRDGTRSRRPAPINVNVNYPSAPSSRVNIQQTNQVCNSTPSLFTEFLVNQLDADGIQPSPELTRLQNRQPAVDAAVANYLRQIGDDLSNNRQLNHLISGMVVTPETAYKTFVSVAGNVFSDGTINWGRVVTLFYFAYKLALQVIDQLPLIELVIGWVSKFVAERLATWIASRGGWTAIKEYFGPSMMQFGGVFLAGILSAFIFIKFFSKP